MIRSTATLVTAPASEPITLEELKAWAKIDGDDEDALLTSMIYAARESAEKYMRRALVTQTWKLTVDMPRSSLADSLGEGTYDLPVTALDGDMSREFQLPYPNLQSITSVKTYDTSNTESTYDSANYFADTANSRLVLNNTAVWPSNLRSRAALVITYTTGYGTAAAVPHAIRTGIKMHAQKMFDGRVICEMPESCEMLYRQFKVYG